MNMIPVQCGSIPKGVHPVGLRGKRAAAVIVLACSLGFAIWALFFMSQGSAMASAKTREVKAAKVRKQDIVSFVSATGVVEETEAWDIYTPQPLKVTAVYVRRGDRVKAGEVLLEFDTSQIRSQLEQLRVSKRIQEKAMEKLRNTEVRKSTTQLENAVTRARNAVNAAWSGCKPLRVEFDQAAALYKAGKESKMEYLAAASALKQAEKAVEDAEFAFETAQANLEEVMNANRQLEKAREADLAIQEENLNAVLLKIQEAEKLLSDVQNCRKSPISGIAAEVYVVVGGYSGIQLPIIRVVDDTALEIRTSIKEYDAARVRPGQSVEISGDGLGEGEKVAGTVLRVSPLARKNKSMTGEETLVEAFVSIDRMDESLRPGLNVTCRIRTAEKHGALVVNYMSVKDEMNGGKSVFVILPDGSLAGRPVKLGIHSETDVEVKEGLKEGEWVVTNWNPSFKTGDKAKITEEGR